MQDVAETNARYWDERALDTEFTISFELDPFAARVARDARILDVGCGYGRTLAQLRDAGFTDLAGTDISAGLVAKGLRLHPGLNLIHHPGPGLPFADASFDALILLAVLTCIPSDEDQEALTAEARRVLAPGGTLYVADFLLNSDERNLKRYQSGLEKYGQWGVFDIPQGAVLRHHSRERINHLFTDLGEPFFREEVFKTMRGHTSRGFTFLASTSCQRS